MFKAAIGLTIGEIEISLRQLVVVVRRCRARIFVKLVHKARRLRACVLAQVLIGIVSASKATAAGRGFFYTLRTKTPQMASRRCPKCATTVAPPP